MKRRSIVLAALLGAGLLALSSYASPYWRLHQLRTAVAERDAAKVSAFIDYPALRASVKIALMEELGAGGLADAARENPFAAFGQAMALAVIDPVVDAVVSPAGVSAMLEAGEVRIRRAPAGERDPSSTPPAGQGDAREESPEKPRYDLSYRSWDRVAVAKEDGDGGAFILHRHGLWSWKLGGVELPRRARHAE